MTASEDIAGSKPSAALSRGSAVFNILLVVVALMVLFVIVGLALTFAPEAFPPPARSWIIDHGGPTGPLVSEATAPGGHWVATMYQADSGGATGDSFVRVLVAQASNPGATRSVYFKPTWDTGMVWTGPDSLVVNGTEIDVRYDTHLDLLGD